MTYFNKGEARRVDRPKALTDAARELRCEPAAIDAVFLAETPFGSFWKNGVLKCLVEKHVVRRQLPKAKQAEAVRLGLATTSWKDNNYRGEQRTWQDRYALLEKIAAKYGPEIAARSASWGGSQIMGYHYAKLGYSSAMDMYKAFADDEAAHIDGFIRYLKTFGVIDALRAKDWAGVALRYNGNGQVAAYSEKMAHNYANSKLPKRVLEFKPREPAPPAPDLPAPRPGGRNLFALVIEILAKIFRGTKK